MWKGMTWGEKMGHSNNSSNSSKWGGKWGVAASNMGRGNGREEQRGGVKEEIEAWISITSVNE